MKKDSGYLRSGSRVLIDALVREIDRLGGSLCLREPAREIALDPNGVRGVRTDGGFEASEAVASTMLIPQLTLAEHHGPRN